MDEFKTSYLKQDQIFELIDELTCLKPNQQKIKKYCENLGLEYKKDTIDLMSDVLFYSGLSQSSQSKLLKKSNSIKILTKEI